MNYLSGIMTDFSIGQSLLTIERLKESLSKTNYKTVLIADDMTVSGLIAIQNAFKGTDVKAVVGVKLRIYQDPTKRKNPKETYSNPYFIIKVYPQDEEGLKSIFKVLTLANSPERYYYNPRCGLQDLALLRNVVVTTGDIEGVSNIDDWNRVCDSMMNSVTLVELVPVNTPYWDRINYERCKLAESNRTHGVICTYPTLYQTLDQADSLKPLKAVCTNTPIDSEFLSEQSVKNFAVENGLDLGTELQRMKERIQARYGYEMPASMLESIDSGVFLNQPFYAFEKHAPCLPKMAENEFETLVELCKEGWNRRLYTEHMGYMPHDLAPYKERLVYELKVLKKMGFAGYFLVVSDLVNWSKNNGVKVGCGRGSGAGSLVAFLIGITEIDPIRFNLIFERFINPERLDLPDIDLDYQSSKRHRVIEYLRERHGADRVAGISNYGTLASASAFRDTGRIYGLSALEMSATKLVLKENGIPMSLTESAEQVPEIDKLRSQYPEIWRHALNFEGVMRSLGQHAAGTVVAGEPLVNRAVVEKRSEDNVVNWDKRVVEDFGLIKMDILGLSTLDVLDIAQQLIKARHNIDVDYLKLPLDDKKVLAMFARGDTTAVFQFDSQGMQTLLQRLARGGELSFDDITTATALYRPGTLESGLTEEYVQIKQGLKAPHYEHPVMKNALAVTNGVMVYQEQIMQIARDLAGFTFGQADLLRRAIGKKDAKKMATMKESFINGCAAKSGLDVNRALGLWDKIEKFALYSFNKSHSVAYSVLSYWTAWVKTYYPAEYFASQLSIVKEDKYPSLIENATLCDINVMPPDINFSTDKFSIKDDKTIVMPFSAVKGLSEKTALRIVEVRNRVGGRFLNKEHFEQYARAKGSGINKRVVENLDKVGAFASIEYDQPSADDESRLRDQIELMGGLVNKVVKVENVTKMDEQKRIAIKSVADTYMVCDACDLRPQPHVIPLIGGSRCNYVMVFDTPTADESTAGKMMVGEGARLIREVFKEYGISMSTGYFTALVKAKKNGKFLSNQQINGCSGFLDQEIKLLNPDLIICMGSSSTKHFLPEIKSPSAEVGKSFYSKELKANILVGFNPLQILFNSGKFKDLEAVARTAAKTLGTEKASES